MQITLSQLAEMEGVSTAHLSHFFRKAFGMTFQTYISTQRTEKALVLLRDPTVPLSEIYMRFGFSDRRYFEAACQKTFGCSVAEYRGRCGKFEDETRKDEEQLFSEYRWEESLAVLKEYFSPEEFVAAPPNY